MGCHCLDRAPGDAFVEEPLGFGTGQFFGVPGNHIDRQAEANIGAPVLQGTLTNVGNQRGNFIRMLGAHKIKVGVFGRELPSRDR
ncbi:hypothetical protein D3C81_1971640 [compost metagenome]